MNMNSRIQKERTDNPQIIIYNKPGGSTNSEFPAFVKAGKTVGAALTASGEGSARDRCAEATEGTQARP